MECYHEKHLERTALFRTGWQVETVKALRRSLVKTWGRKEIGIGSYRNWVSLLLTLAWKIEHTPSRRADWFLLGAYDKVWIQVMN